MLNSILSDSQNQLRNNWIVAIATVLVYGILTAVSASFVIGILVTGHLSVGIAMWSLNVARGQELSMERLFEGFKNFIPPMVASLLMSASIVIGLVFFIIPGIIIALGLSQTFYILAEQPRKDGLDALQESWNLMKGHKRTYLLLLIRYFLLGIACIFTLGIGFFFLAPYIHVTNANFFLAIKDESSDSFDAEYVIN